MNLKKFQLIFIIFALSISISSVFAVSDTIEVNQQVIQGVPCNFNGNCEPEFGEDTSTCPSDCPLGGGSAPPVSIYNVSVDEITLNSAEISWGTDRPALCHLFWGRTQEYERGVITETDYRLEHSLSLVNLFAGTAYHFKIRCRDLIANESETTDRKFIALSPLPNVINFTAVPGDSEITLTWQNPLRPDFKVVKIMRGNDFYPSDPFFGIQVYSGSGDYFLDTGLTNGLTYYYTAFTVDFAGNYSSGAVASARPFSGEPPFPSEEILTKEECQEANYYWYDDSCHAEPEPPPPPPEIEELNLEDFDFIQEGEELPLIEGKKIEFKTENPLTISIDYEKVPEVLKTIMVTFKKEGKTFSFLLRINQEKTIYQAAIVPPEPGTYPLILTVLDYKNQALKKIFGQLSVIETQPLSLFQDIWQRQGKIWLWVLGIIFFAVLVIFFRRKLKEGTKLEYGP
jgi:hypothetical protein